MKIKEFVENYNKIAIESLRTKYIKDNIEIKSYIPFITKDALAEKLVNVSTYKYEDYTKEDGTIGRRKTDVIRVNSTAQYLLFCRLVIENYTNLTVETEGFYEEYDLLKQSGLLDRLMVNTENKPSLIPFDEIAEFKTIVDMKQSDVMTNYGTPQAYISNQVERFSTILGVTLNPFLEKITEKLENMTEEDMDKATKKFDNFLKRIK